MAFILCHEFAHVEKGHLEKLKSKRLTNEELKNLENEADQRAIELILEGVEENTKQSINAGLVIGLSCLFYFKPNTESNTHPNSEKRLLNLIEAINPNKEDALWGIASVALKQWFTQFNRPLILPLKVANFKELFYKIIKNID